MNIDIEKIMYVLPLVVCSIAQIILMATGKTDKAMQLEQKKQKLIRKRNKHLTLAEKETEKIKEIKENVASLKESE